MIFKRLHISLWAILFATTLVAQLPESDSIKWSIDIEDVVVTAQYAPTDSRNAVQEIKTIKKEMIQRRGANNLEQLLNMETSVRIKQDAILGSSISLGGIDGQNVKIMIDGVPVIGRRPDGNLDISQINLNQVERVEIVEGPLSVQYGTDALGGVINLITKKSQLKRFEYGLSSQVEDKGENSYSARFGSRLTDQLLLSANGGYDHFDGFGSDTTRSVLWNPKEQMYADAALRYTLPNDQNFRYAFSWFDEKVTNLGDLRRPQFKPYSWDHFYNTLRFSHSLTHKGEVLNDYYTQTTIAYNQFNRLKNTFRINFDDNSLEVVNGQQDTSQFNGAMMRSIFASKYDGKLNFQVGADLRHDQGFGQRIVDTLTGNDPGFAEMGDYAVFGTVKYLPIENLTVEPGLRVIYNTRYSAPLIPSLNIKYDLTDNWVGRGSFGKGFRSPDLKELFQDFVDVNHFIKGNPNLEAEKSNNFQLGFNYSKRKDKNRLDIKIKGFYNQIKDKIGLYEFEEEGGMKSPKLGTGDFTSFNIDVFKTRGVNLSANYQVKNFGINVGLLAISYFNPTSETFEEVDTFSPTYEVSSELKYYFPKPNLTLSFFTRVNDKFIEFYPDVDDKGNPIASQQFVDGYTMMDFTTTKTFWKKRIGLTAGVKNLLDVQQVNQQSGGSGPHSGSSSSQLISPGRNFFVSFSYGM